MNENIDLTKILKCCPKGTKFWSMLDEEVEFVDIDGDCINFRATKTNASTFFYNDGKAYRGIGECVLLPSKEQRDWSKFVPTWETKKEVVKVTLHPFDKVLVRVGSEHPWLAQIVTFITDDVIETIDGEAWCLGVPYNKDTAHLLGTSDEPEIEYEIEFSKEL
jgi:hypothetical protein